MNATSGHVFISHGSDDRDQANALSAFIEARGIRTWIAPRNVRPGQDYSEQLQQAIEQCAAFVVLVTDKANSSPYVRAETEMAFSTSKPIFPVRQSDIQPAAGLAFFLKIRHWTDAFGKHGDSAMERLGLELDSLFGITGPEPAPAPPLPTPPAPPQPDPAAPAAQVTTPPTAPATTPPVTIPQAAPVTTPPVAAPPAAPLPLAPPPLPAEQEERLSAAIGPNAPTYLEKWRRMDAKGSALSWNWPAFLANIFWFAYRRMWIPLAAGVVLFILTDFVVGRDPALGALGWLFLLALTIASGAFGNALYRRQVNALVAKADGLDQPVALAQIRAQGGVSIPGLVSTLAAFILLFVAAGVANMNQQRQIAQTVQPAAPNAPAQPTDQPAAPTQIEQPAAPAAPTLDSAFLIGRWSDGGGDCGSMFNNDGTFSADDGSRGLWNLSGNQLTLTGASTMILQVVVVDANTINLFRPDGSSIHGTRC